MGADKKHLNPSKEARNFWPLYFYCDFLYQIHQKDKV